MTTSTDLDHDVVLDDGSTIGIRPIHRTDAGRLVRFHHTLSADTTRWRFFTFHPELSPKELERFTHVDHARREAVVALVHDEIIGVARYDREAGTDLAEVAFVVTDDWQGRGVAKALFVALLARAREVGIEQFEAVMLAGNIRMLRVFRRTGLVTSSRFDDGMVRVTMDLRPRVDA